MMKAIGRKNEGKPRDTDEVMEAQPLIVHLMALRKVIIICLAAVVVLFSLVFFGFSSRLVQYVSDPLAGQGVQVIYTEVSEAFGAQTKLSLIAGVVLASPVIFAAVWWFVRPALTPKERVSALGYLLTAMFLFFIGVLFAYRFVFFLFVNFFVTMGDSMAVPMFSLGKYIDFLFAFLVPFGIMFELPVVVIWLAKLGLITASQLKRARKYCILVIFTIAAILTPPDVVSQCMLAFPLLALFEISVLCAGVFGSKDKA